MPADILSPKGRFETLFRCLQDGADTPGEFRIEIMQAYGFDVSHLRESDMDVPKRELELAETMLRGDTLDQNELLGSSRSSASLRDVILKELGTHLVGRDTEQGSHEYPWFGGNWVSMARLAKTIAEWQLHRLQTPAGGTERDRIKSALDDLDISPTQSICVWPIDEIDQRKMIPGGDEIVTKVILGTSERRTTREDNISLLGLQNNHSWVVLPVPPKKLYAVEVERPDGTRMVPHNLWSGLQNPPGAQGNR